MVRIVDAPEIQAQTASQILVESTEYADLHRLFLQYLLYVPQHAISDARLELKLALIASKLHLLKPTPSLFINTFNEEIAKLDLELCLRQCEPDGHRVWFLVNRVDDDITRQSALFSAQDIASYKRILEQMASQTWYITSMQALRERPTGMSLQDMEKVLDRFCYKGWLDRAVVDAEAGFTVGARACVELESMLRAGFPDSVQNCPGCQHLVLRVCFPSFFRVDCFYLCFDV